MVNRTGGKTRLLRWAAVCLLVPILLLLPASQAGAVPPGPPYGSPDWVLRELRNWDMSFQRLREQQQTPGFLQAVVPAERNRLLAFFAGEDNKEFRGRPRMTLTRWAPSLFLGDPWRNELSWEAAGGAHERVYFLNRWGAKLTGDLWGPPGMAAGGVAYPLVVITTGSIQGNARMYWWAAQTLAENGYVVLTYDVQGQGESETFGHKPDGSIWCDGVSQPPDTPEFLTEMSSCPGFPFQQPANFGVGAIDSFAFAVSAPTDPYGHWADGTGTARFNPWHEHIDRTRIGIAGHSLGAAAVSFVQAHPEYLDGALSAVVAWDSLSWCSAYERSAPPLGGDCRPEGVNTPKVPALNLSSDYFLSLLPNLGRPPDPKDGLTAFGLWRDAGQDVLSLALRGSTHLEYTSVPGVTPFFSASKYGQDVSAYYTLAFFDAYVKGDPTAVDRLLARSIEVTHRNPLGVADPAPVSLDVGEITSLYSDSGISLGGACYTDWGGQLDPC